MQDLVSIGKLAENLQRSPRVIERALAELEIESDLALNDVRYFQRAAVNKLKGFFYNTQEGD